MRRMRMFCVALLAVFAAGGALAAIASAEEGNVKPGLLFLPGEEGPISGKGKGGKSILKTATGRSISCESSEAQSDPESEQEKGTHITLIKVHSSLSGCKEGKLGCNTEGDPKEQILGLGDMHFVSLLEGTKLRPGVAGITLNAKHEEGTMLVKCGVGLIEVRGVGFGLATVSSLTADVTSGTISSPTTLKCDTNDELCKKLEEKPLEVNFTGKFEAATTQGEGTIETSKMVVVDD